MHNGTWGRVYVGARCIVGHGVRVQWDIRQDMDMGVEWDIGQAVQWDMDMGVAWDMDMCVAWDMDMVVA